MQRRRWLASVAQSGAIELTYAGKRVATVAPGLFEKEWRGAGLKGAARAPEGDSRFGVIRSPGGTTVDCVLTARDTRDGVSLRYRITPRASVALNSLHVSMDFPAGVVAGGRYVADGEPGSIPTELGEVHLRSGPTRSLVVELPGGAKLSAEFASPTPVLLQDNRRWGPSFTARIGPQIDAGTPWPAGRSLELAFDLTAEGGMKVEHDAPVTIEAGEDWIPLAVELDIVPGSALDLSGAGGTGAPAGKHGRLIARNDGRFAFERDPDTPRRFYGVNLCFSAHYITHDESDRLARRLQRLGYNALRFHHHEGELISGGGDISTIPVGTAPSSTSDLTSFESPSGIGERYGSRIRGLLHPPATGEYVFFIASDDDGDLFLSPDEDPAKKVRIAHMRGWAGRREWDKYATQRSAPVRLEAGKRYYIEALHREGEGGDHVEVAWKGPGAEVIEGVILGAHLSPSGGGARGKVVHEVWRDPVRNDSTAPNPAKLDQLDYLFAALKKRGIYLTTDLYVSRPVLAREIWDGAEGRVEMNGFKMLVPVNDRAFENWKEFTRELIGHVNPYTGMTWAADPALGWLSMINEGNFGNFIGKLDERIARDWTIAWNRWLAKRYSTRAALAAAWGKDPAGDPAGGTVPLHRNAYDGSAKGRDLVVFFADVEIDMFRRMKRFLRDELGTKALLTNMNSWTNRIPNQAARAEYDYVDDHFYVDHPQFLENSWQLPSRCPNASPVAGGATGGRGCSFTRLLDKPFTISEYNYSGPGRFRGVGGIITGSMGAIQDWDVIWRFTYSHSRENLFKPGRANYFDLVADPLNQAADRASVCLYLRGDMKPAPHAVAVAMTRGELMGRLKKNVNVAPAWHALALVTRVGTHVGERAGEVPADVILPVGWETPRSAYRGGEVLDVDPYSKGAGGKVLEALRRKGWLEGNATNLARNVLQSETGELLIDAPRDVMVLATPMTAGGYAPEGERIEAGPVAVDIVKTDATVWASSVDGRPIRESRRLVITHLTDLQNSGARFGERARQTLTAWGDTPHLVLAGSATIAIGLAGARGATVYELATSGRRVREVESEVRRGWLVVPLDVRGPDGARMIYEVEVR